VAALELVVADVPEPGHAPAIAEERLGEAEGVHPTRPSSEQYRHEFRLGQGGRALVRQTFTGPIGALQVGNPVPRRAVWHFPLRMQGPCQRAGALLYPAARAESTHGVLGPML
jgi:hypothetical protein